MYKIISTLMLLILLSPCFSSNQLIVKNYSTERMSFVLNTTCIEPSASSFDVMPNGGTYTVHFNFNDSCAVYPKTPAFIFVGWQSKYSTTGMNGFVYNGHFSTTVIGGSWNCSTPSFFRGFPYYCYFLQPSWHPDYDVTVDASSVTILPPNQ